MSPPLRRWLPLAVALVLLAHAISLGHGFVDFDDDAIFLANPTLHRTDWGLLTALFDWSRPDDWRPLRDLSHWLDYALHGFDPALTHLHHLLVLGGVVTVVGVFYRRLGYGGWLAFAALVLAYVHPVQVEVIGWISGRKDLLASIGFFLSLIAFIRFLQTDRPWRWAAATVAALALGIMGKGHVIVAPGVLLMLWLYARWRDDIEVKRSARAIGGLIGGILAGCLAIAPRMAGGRVVLPEAYGDTLQFSLVLGDRLQLPLRYVRNLVWPTDLNHIYLTPRLDELHTVMTVASTVLALGIVALGLWWLRRRDPRAPLLAIVVGVMVPYMHFKPGVVYMADRYLFIAMPFIALLAVDSAHRLATRFELAPRVQGLVMAVVLLAAGLMAFGEHAAWRDPVSLWSRMTRVYPESDWGFDRLGRALYREGRYAEAGGAFLAAADRNPKRVKHLNNAAVSAMAVGENAAAAALLRRAEQVAPDDPLVKRNLGKLGLEPTPR